MGFEIKGYEHEVKSVTVKIEKKLKVNQSLNIHPSEGYLGIEEGQVTIKALLKYEDVPETASQVEVDNAFDEEHEKELKEGLWVAYEYVSSQRQEPTFYMPLDVFVEHTLL